MPDIYWDVDGTLIDKDNNIRPFVKECFEALKTKGFTIFVWSGGGCDYAKRQLHRIFVTLDMNIPVIIIPKEFDYVRCKDSTAFCVDDTELICHIFDEYGGKGFKVPFYESTIHKDDTELKKIMESL